MAQKVDLDLFWTLLFLFVLMVNSCDQTDLLKQIRDDQRQIMLRADNESEEVIFERVKKRFRESQEQDNGEEQQDQGTDAGEGEEQIPYGRVSGQ